MKRQANNIGVLRLLFASLVIVGHGPELLDGDRSREPFHYVFGIMSLGEFSVDAFFLISGYLITKSWFNPQTRGRYLAHRVLRIYPAFIVASLISVFALGPFVGAHPWRWLPQTVLRLVTLEPPADHPGQLAGLHYPLLNGAMWTLAFEFRCYVAVALMGLTGLLVRGPVILIITSAMLLATIAVTFHAVGAPLTVLARRHQVASYLVTNPGQPLAVFRLTAAFLVGACGFLYRDRLQEHVNGLWAAACAVSAAGLLFHDTHFGEICLFVFGGAALYWLAFKADTRTFSRVNNSWDISYGVYLYGWPAATAMLWWGHPSSPWIVSAGSLAIAVVAGAASWWGVEKWAKDLARPRSRPLAIDGAD